MIGVLLGRLGLVTIALATASAVAFSAVAPAQARIVDGDPSITVPRGGTAKGNTSAGFTTGVKSNAYAVSVAKRYIGGNPTGRRSSWCADFIGLVEKKVGRKGSGSSLAKSYLAYGKPVSSPQPGDIVVLWRPGGGHVGYFMGWKDGKVELISGNHGRKVGIGVYPKSRVLGYRRPS